MKIKSLLGDLIIITSHMCSTHASTHKYIVCFYWKCFQLIPSCIIFTILFKKSIEHFTNSRALVSSEKILHLVLLLFSVKNIKKNNTTKCSNLSNNEFHKWLMFILTECIEQILMDNYRCEQSHAWHIEQLLSIYQPFMFLFLSFFIYLFIYFTRNKKTFFNFKWHTVKK